MNFQMFKLDLEKAEEPEIKLATSFGSLKKQGSSRKTSTFALLPIFRCNEITLSFLKLRWFLFVCFVLFKVAEGYLFMYHA